MPKKDMKNKVEEANNYRSEKRKKKIKDLWATHTDHHKIEHTILPETPNVFKKAIIRGLELSIL